MKRILARGIAIRRLPSCYPSTMRYHSYPDPTDVGKISEFRANSEKLIDKTKNIKDFTISSDFRLDRQFPGVPVSKGVDKSSPPATITTVLANGITVSSQELPTLMSSFAVLFTVGRYSISISPTLYTLPILLFLSYVLLAFVARMNRPKTKQLELHMLWNSQHFIAPNLDPIRR